jgi:uncharacterized protein YwgA
MKREEIVAAVLAAAGGQLTGRVRLQKTVYLLDQLGMSSGFSFEYHHYGPYSRELDDATSDAKAFDLIEEKKAYRQSDGASYSIFTLKNSVSKHESFGRLSIEKTGALVHLFAGTNVTVLELAATVDWLWRSERYSDWKGEIIRRKGVKVQHGRLEKAVALLRQLDLDPPEPAIA